MSGMSFQSLKKNLSRDFAGLCPLRLALLGDAPTQLLAQAVRGLGWAQGLDATIYDAGIDQLEAEILDVGSGLWAFDPRHVVLYTSVEAWLERFAALAPAAREGAAEASVARLSALWAQVARQAPGATVIQLNFPEVDDGVWGSYANKVLGSARHQLRRLNVQLAEAAMAHGHVFIADLAALQARVGRAALFDPRHYYASNQALALDALPAVAKCVLDIARAADGEFRKALVLDLDDTLWGGILAEDGLEGIQIGHAGVGHAFADLQRWARQLRERGVLLAVASKNDPALAREAFERHPEMVLRLADFAAFQASWDTKVESLRAIRDALNIGLEAIVFLDDNPFEREMVRRLLPDVWVPELPADPGERPAWLAAQNFFETASTSAADAERTRQLHAAQAAIATRAQFETVDEYLASLAMTAGVAPVDALAVPRVAQLTQRSNQFNLRTVRYSESEVARLAASPDHLALAFTLADVHGDHGLVGVIIGEKRPCGSLFLDTWLMSCRVLKRGMEDFMLNAIAEAAREAGCSTLLAEYVPTSKNALVKDLLPGLGFAPAGAGWELALAGAVPRPSFISRRASQHGPARV